MNDVSALLLEQLQQENTRLLALIGQKEQAIQTLQHQLHLFRTARFGRKSEKGVVPEQMAIQFDEAVPVDEANVTEQPVAPETQTITYTRTKKNTGRKPLPRSLPYIEHVYDLSDEEKQCPCGCTLTHIRDEISEQLDIVPQMTFRVVHIRKQYACKICENTMKCAKKPEQPISHSIATPGLLAAIINTKFRCHTPLYRQETMFGEAGISLTRGTLGNWVIKAADLLTPLVKLMEDDIQSYDVAYADETTLQVLKEKSREPAQNRTCGCLLEDLLQNRLLFTNIILRVRIKSLPISLLISRAISMPIATRHMSLWVQNHTSSMLPAGLMHAVTLLM